MFRARGFVTASIRNRLDGSYNQAVRRPYRERLPADLEPVAAKLRAHRVEADAFELDELKRRAMARSALRHGRQTLMKSRVATMLTIVGLAGGTGGALAVAAAGGHPGGNGGAASGQYKPGKGCGDKNHTHTGPPGNPGNTSCP
jgi:hypothetical protein